MTQSSAQHEGGTWSDTEGLSQRLEGTHLGFVKDALPVQIEEEVAAVQEVKDEVQLS